MWCQGRPESCATTIPASFCPSMHQCWNWQNDWHCRGHTDKNQKRSTFGYSRQSQTREGLNESVGNQYSRSHLNDQRQRKPCEVYRTKIQSNKTRQTSCTGTHQLPHSAPWRRHKCDQPPVPRWACNNKLELVSNTRDLSRPSGAQPTGTTSTRCHCQPALTGETGPDDIRRPARDNSLQIQLGWVTTHYRQRGTSWTPIGQVSYYFCTSSTRQWY